MSAFIYALSDPRDGGVRYIGVTSVSVGRRLNRHIYDAKHGCQVRRSRWIRTLIADGVLPTALVLETDVARDREIYWIARFRAEGADLTNCTDGGEGMPGYQHSDEFRAALTKRNTGTKPTAETRASISASLMGTRPSEETRAKLSKASRGRPKSAEMRRKLGDYQRGRPKSPEARQKQSETMRRVHAAKREALEHADG